MEIGEEKVTALAMFQRLRAKAGRHIDTVVQEEGLSPLQGCMLAQVAEGAMPVGELSDRLQIGQANTSTMCKKLEQAGYLARERSPRDERVVLLSLTEKGVAAAERIKERVARCEQAIEELPPAIREDFLRGLAAADIVLDYLARYI